MITSEYEYMKSILNDTKLYNFMLSMSNNSMEQPRLIVDILDLLCESNPLHNTISDGNKAALVRMLRRYYMGFGDLFLINDYVTKYIRAAKTSIYYMELFDDVRIATVKEIEDGAVGLIERVTYPLGEDKYRLLNLLEWTLRGKLSFYRESGYSYKYSNENRALAETVYDLVTRAANSMMDLVVWGESDFSSDIKTLKKCEKYRYPTYAADEVKSQFTIRQIVYYISNNLSRAGNTEDAKEALYLIARCKKDRRFQLTPMNKSFLRRFYNKIKENNGEYSEDVIEPTEKEPDNQLKIDCERILEGAKSGVIESNDFALKIIDTLRRFNYKGCSTKQYKFIQVALEKIDAQQSKAVEAEKTIEPAKIDSGDSMLDISNALGSGLF